MSLRFKIYFGYAVICLLWGSSWAAVKLGLENLPVFLSLSIRFSIACVILWAIVIARRLKIPKDKHFWMLALVLCAISFTIPFVLIYWAQIQLNSGLSSVLFATFPLWVAILSHYFLPNEKITMQRIIGLVLGFIGIVFIFNNGFSDVNTKTLFSMTAVIIGAILQAAGLIVLRRYGRDMHPVMLNLWPMLFSIMPFIIASLIIDDYSSVHFDKQTIGSLIYLSIFCTVVAFLIYFWLVKHVEAVILSLTSFITPVMAIIISVILMGEEFTMVMYVGSSLVLIGIAVAFIGDLIVHKRSSAMNPLN